MYRNQALLFVICYSSVTITFNMIICRNLYISVLQARPDTVDYWWGLLDSSWNSNGRLVFVEVTSNTTPGP